MQHWNLRIALKWLLIVMIAGFFGTAAHAEQPKPEDFIHSISDEAINTLTISTIDKKTREERMLKFLDRYADIAALAKFVVGRYWTKGSTEQQKEYSTLFREYNAKNFAALLSTYSGQKLEIIRSNYNKTSDNYTVQTVIIGKTATDKVKIDWQLRLQGESFVITDFVVEGLSQASTMRDDFATTLKGSTDLSKLIEVLKKKIATMDQNKK